MHPLTSILIRLPNWLGDMVMAVGFVQAVRDLFPDTEIDLIAKKELADLVPLFSPQSKVFGFSKKEYGSFFGPVRFGREIKKRKKYDLFFCLPDSLSAAMMAGAIGAKERIGFSNGVNGLFFTKTFARVKAVHRAEEYFQLLADYKNFLRRTQRNTATTVLSETGLDVGRPPSTLGRGVGGEVMNVASREPVGEVKIFAARRPAGDVKPIIVNINSEASSRRLPADKAISLLNDLASAGDTPITLIGAPKEREYVESVRLQLQQPDRFTNIAGKTTLPGLAEIFANAAVVLSTDSGPAHLANATGVHTVVLFGAGNENHTAPFNKENRTIIRLGQLSCEPCTDNVCKRYGTPKCLTDLENGRIINALRLSPHPLPPFPSERVIASEIVAAVSIMRSGGVILYPTDTIWGLGCDATNAPTVAKIFAIKKRAEAKSLIVLAKDSASVANITSVALQDINTALEKAASPRPTTIIYPGARNLAPNVIAEDGSVGIRIPQHDFCQQLLKAFGKPIVSTSANISAEAPPRSFADISDEIKEAVDYIVPHARNEKANLPSKILKLNIDGSFQTIRD